MSYSSDLEKLRFLRRVQLQQLAQTDRWIEAARRRARDDAARAARGAAMPESEPKTWRACVPADARQTVELHRADCRVEHPELETRDITTTEARKLGEMGAEMSCPQCWAGEAARSCGRAQALGVRPPRASWSGAWSDAISIGFVRL